MAAEPISIVGAGEHGDAGYLLVDVSAFSTLRLDLDVTAAQANSNNPPLLCLWLDTGPENDGVGANWRELAAREATGIGTQRITVSGLDSYVRIRWTARSKYRGVDHGFQWSLGGEAV